MFDIDTSKFTRVEVIDDTGCVYTCLDVGKLMMIVRDYGKTLTIFVGKEEKDDV